MLTKIRIFGIFLMIAALGFISRTPIKDKGYYILDFFISNKSELVTMENANGTSSLFSANTILREGNGILFIETTDRMDPPSLVLCAIESAARVYPDRPVVFFMKGLEDIATEEDEKRARQQFPTLSSYRNVYLFPLRMDQLFNNTPLELWFDKVDPKREVYWTHVSSDACRFAIMWKYGGIYMDTDVISLRPIPQDHFVAAETLTATSSSVFGLSSHYQLTWQFMENFVQNYRGEIWGHQGPGVFTRVVKKLCGMPVFTSTDDVMCTNISYFHPRRFYPILYPEWTSYFEVWQSLPTFNDSYALHLWNFMNKEVGNIIDWMKGRPLASTDQIITSLEISRVIYLLTCMSDGASKLLLKKAVVITIVFHFLQMTSNYSCVWFLTLLSVVFCLKISNFHNVFFQCLRSIISARVIHLIIGSVLISASQASLNVWLTHFEFSNNYTFDFTLDFTRPKVQMFLLWNTTPFLIYLVAGVSVIAYLSFHIRRMKREAKMTHLDSYYKAIWFTTISFFTCAIHISLNVNPAYYYSSFIYVMLHFLPMFHSIFLILAMKKLKNRLSWILQQVSKLWSVRASGTSF